MVVICQIVYICGEWSRNQTLQMPEGNTPYPRTRWVLVEWTVSRFHILSNHNTVSCVVSEVKPILCFKIYSAGFDISQRQVRCRAAYLLEQLVRLSHLQTRSLLLGDVHTVQVLVTNWKIWTPSAAERWLKEFMASTWSCKFAFQYVVFVQKETRLSYIHQ